MEVNSSETAIEKENKVASPSFIPGGAPAAHDVFGANGTPMAVLIDEEGKIASEVAAGAPAVLALAGIGQNQSQVLAQSR